MWMVYRGDSDALYSAFFDGATWYGDVKIADQPGDISPKSDHNPGICVYNERLYAVYKGADKSDLYMCWTDGSSWAGDQKISSMPGGIAPNSNNRPCLVVFEGQMWAIYRSASSNDLYQAVFDGTTWSGDQKISSMPGSISPKTSEGVDAVVFKGCLYLVYKGESSNDLYTAWFDGQTWHGNTKIKDQPGGIAPQSDHNPGLAVFDGRLYIVYKAGDDDLFVAWSDGEVWAGDVGISSQPGAIAPQSNGGPGVLTFDDRMYVVYRGPSSEDLSSAWYDGSTWGGDVEIGSQPGGISPKCSTNPHLAFWSIAAQDASFSMAITSDPQYPWYDGVLPSGLSGDQVAENSERQIREQYDDINALAESRIPGDFPVKGVLINGDLTAYGHDWQLETYSELLGRLEPPSFPALGNHDYANNVDDTFNNSAATGMAAYMYDWLKRNESLVRYDCDERSYYQFPELRTDYTGSMAYSFNLGRVHFVQLQNYPSYENSWNSWNVAAAGRDFYFIESSFHWLANDLAQARNRGDIILVSLHDYHQHFNEPYVSQFNELMELYGVSAVFAGHIHESCGKVNEPIGDSGIPFFRSGAAAFQDYLVADIDPTQKVMTVRKRAAPYPGEYAFTGEEWSCVLDDTVPDPPLPVPAKDGSVTFFNEGGFVARCELRYTYNGVEYRRKTGDMDLGNKKSYSIPPTATDVRVIGKEQTGLVWEGWRTVFDLSFPSPPNQCFKLYGTTLNPKWNNNCS
jgi:cytolysin (calcineurin-like family phosphatase)